ncbi:MAG: T9SS type A sorting domain-containing protein [Flavobacteriales bacterium]|nr:T9SS type A sorting domain-containing protein [Flavobacteriales bacterium]
MRVTKTLVVMALSALSLFANGQGEVVSPLSARPLEQPEGYAKSMHHTHFNYQFETQSLPLMDDFSIDRTRKLWASPTDPGVTLDQTIYALEVAGVSEFDMTFATDTTFYYTIDAQDPPVTTRIALPSFIVTVLDLEVYPPTETMVTAWPPYSVFDTLASPPNDTVFQLTPALVQDSLLVYTVPPVGGTYIMNGVSTPLILWADDDVYINDTYPVDPPTIGVATFDGLSRTGYPYNFQQYTAYGIADHMTSVPINLQYSPADSIYLSFFYQNQGLSGDGVVQPGDSLAVEFYAPNEDVWVRVWRKKYEAITDFQQVLIPIIQDRFLKNGFRMRFLNYGSLSGSFDHWHLDYMRLGAQRTYNDVTLVDVAYEYPENTLLNTYTSVPFTKYAQAPSALMVPSIGVEQCNLDATDAFITFGMSASLTDGSGATNIFNGTNTMNNASSCFVSQHGVNDSMFTYDTSLSTDAAFWKVKFWTMATPDINSYNDTTSFVQVLSNYYAYDDGSAEAGYSLASAGAKVALQYDLLGGDSLRAIRMYFNPAANPPGDTPPYDGLFLLTVWSSISPEVIQHQNFTFDSPEYRQDGVGYFVEYPLDTAIYVDGTIYIGWVQTNNTKMYLGLDRNTDNSNKVFYKTGTAFQPSTIPGSLMMRPVMVATYDPWIGINETTGQQEIQLYPNPANNTITIRTSEDPGPNAMVQCIDAMGRIVHQERYVVNGTLETSAFADGIYVIRVNDEDGRSIAMGRAVIQH